MQRAIVQPRELKSFVTQITPSTHQKLRFASALLNVPIRDLVEQALNEFFTNHGLTEKLDQLLKDSTTTTTT